MVTFLLYICLFLETPRRMRTKSEERGDGPQIGVYIPVAHRSHRTSEELRYGLRIRIQHGALIYHKTHAIHISRVNKTFVLFYF